MGTEVPTGADNRLIILIGGAMEDKLFYAYLKYQKDSMRDAWSNLLKLHWTVLLPFSAARAALNPSPKPCGARPASTAFRGSRL